MGTENDLARPNFAPRPFFPAPPSSMPSSSSNSNPVAGSSAPPGLMAGPDVPGFRPAHPTRFSDPSVPPPQASGSGPFQRFAAPQFPSIPQTPPTARGPPPPLSSPPVTFRPQVAPAPPLPAGSPPQDLNLGAPRPTSQPPMPGFPSKQFSAVPQAPPVQYPFSQQPGYRPAALPPPPPPYVSHQGGYAPPPPPVGLHSREQTPQFGPGPPMGSSVQDLVDDFYSLSIGSVPGSMDPRVNPEALPRPLEGDVEPTFYSETYASNCPSRYVRLTTSAIPNSQSLLSRWHLPLGAVVCPLAVCPKGEEVPIVNLATAGIIRCRRCRTYVNPYVIFTDAGRKWRCNICTLLNEVPGDYFAHLDANGRRIDLDQRPELCKGSVEFVAPTEYMVRPPMPPLYFFLIDVSVFAVRSGMLEVLAQTIKSCLNDLPGFPRTQIGFITYDSTIHFYNMKSSLAQPQMLVVSDLDEIFVPLPDDLLVNLSESRTVVETFLDSLPSMFQDNLNVESAFGPALKAAFMIMNQLGGKLLIFQNTLPSLGSGRLRLRGDDSRVYGTDKEHALRIPEDPFYKQMAADFTKFQIGVNVYAFSDKYTDIASLGTLAKYTGGQVCFYPSFQAAIHKEKFRHELIRDLTRETAWEAVMRVRCGKGVRFTAYHGNFMLRSTDLLALPAVDCDKAFAMQLCLEETLLTTPNVYFQVALLYTSSSGERRIRVHTATAPVVADLGEMYRHADTGAIISLFSRLAIEKTLSSKLEDARSFVQLRIVKALREYRNLYVMQHRLGGRMIFPESLKFLLLYGLALCKSTPLRGGFADAQLDERCAAGFTMMALPIKRLLKLLYPSLIRVDEFLSKASPQSDDLKAILKRLPLSAESLDSRGLYIYDDGFRFILWFGRMLPPDIAMKLLGPDFAADLSKVSISDQDNAMYKKLMMVLKTFREDDPSYYQLPSLVRQGEQPKEGLLILSNLVEDQAGGTNGYIDLLLQTYRQVQQNA